MGTKHVEQAVLARFMPFRGSYVAVMRKESTRIGNGGAVGGFFLGIEPRVAGDRQSLAGLPFALAGTLFSNACNSGSPASANAKE